MYHRACAKEKELLAEEVVVGAVGHTAFVSDVFGVASCVWGFAAAGVQSLYVSDSSQETASRVVNGSEQQPWNCVRAGGVYACDDFSGDQALVTQLPCGSGEVVANYFPILIE